MNTRSFPRAIFVMLGLTIFNLALTPLGVSGLGVLAICWLIGIAATLFGAKSLLLSLYDLIASIFNHGSENQHAFLNDSLSSLTVTLAGLSFSVILLLISFALIKLLFRYLEWNLSLIIDRSLPPRPANRTPEAAGQRRRDLALLAMILTVLTFAAGWLTIHLETKSKVDLYSRLPFDGVSIFKGLGNLIVRNLPQGRRMQFGFNDSDQAKAKYSRPIPHELWQSLDRVRLQTTTDLAVESATEGKAELSCVSHKTSETDLKQIIDGKVFVERRGNSLEISPDVEALKSLDCQLLLSLPKNMKSLNMLSVQTDIGDISIGELPANTLRQIEIATASGRTEVKQNDLDSIKIETANGETILYSHAVQSKIYSTSGSVEIENPKPGTNLQVITSSGDIHVSSASPLNARLLAHSNGAEIRILTRKTEVEFPKTGQIVLGTGTGLYDLKTTSGYIEVDQDQGD